MKKIKYLLITILIFAALVTISCKNRERITGREGLSHRFFAKIDRQINLENQHIIYTDINLGLVGNQTGNDWDLWFKNKDHWKNTVKKSYVKSMPAKSFQSFDGNDFFIYDSVTKTLVKRPNEKNISPSDINMIIARLASDLRAKKIKSYKEVKKNNNLYYLYIATGKEKTMTSEDKLKIVLSKSKFWINPASGDLAKFEKYYDDKMVRSVRIISKKTVKNIKDEDLSAKVKYKNFRIEK